MNPHVNKAAMVSAGVLALALLGLGFVHFREKPPAPSDPVRFRISAPAVSNILNTYMALSPDGKRLAYTANAPDGTLHLWVRSLDALEARMLPGTENGVSAFWSPDGRFLAFAEGTSLKRVNASGDEPPLTLCTLTTPVGMGSWSPAGVIVFGGRGVGALRRVSASGGTPTEVTAVKPGESYHTMPYFLPDGRHKPHS